MVSKEIELKLETQFEASQTQLWSKTSKPLQSRSNQPTYTKVPNDHQALMLLPESCMSQGWILYEPSEFYSIIKPPKIGQYQKSTYHHHVEASNLNSGASIHPRQGYGCGGCTR
jgi:hypothetical protein